MQIILKRDVQNVGEAGDLVNVKDGYARNYLLPKNYAELATAGAIQNREQNLARIKAKQEKLHAEALAKAEQIEKLVSWNYLQKQVKVVNCSELLLQNVFAKNYLKRLILKLIRKLFH